MKNIHIIPTDKPSRLFDDGIELYLGELKARKDHPVTSYNLYITSDDDIKEGDWCICEYSDRGISVNTYKDSSGINKYKVILTTDQDLIKEGVQTIDDEFLEWFVKNPSCEEVEVSYGVLKPFQNTNKGYMIHLPDNEVLEEPKTKCYCGHTTYCDCGPEQEILLEDIFNEEKKKGVKEFIDKHKQDETEHLLSTQSNEKRLLEDVKQETLEETEERSYSEEDMIEFSKFCQTDEFESRVVNKSLLELFEQFKKK